MSPCLQSALTRPPGPVILSIARICPAPIRYNRVFQGGIRQSTIALATYGRHRRLLLLLGRERFLRAHGLPYAAPPSELCWRTMCSGCVTRCVNSSICRAICRSWARPRWLDHLGARRAIGPRPHLARYATARRRRPASAADLRRISPATRWCSTWLIRSADARGGGPAGGRGPLYRKRRHSSCLSCGSTGGRGARHPEPARRNAGGQGDRT